MLAMVTRLAGHKGIDLLCYIAERLMSRRVQLVVIGTGEEKYEWFLRGLQERFGRQVSVNLCFSAEPCKRRVRGGRPLSDAVEV